MQIEYLGEENGLPHELNAMRSTSLQDKCDLTHLRRRPGPIGPIGHPVTHRGDGRTVTGTEESSVPVAGVGLRPPLFVKIPIECKDGSGALCAS
jgi:hypothetical protein